MKVIKATKTGKVTHVVLEGEHITKEQLKELLNTTNGVRFSYFGTEFRNFQEIKDMLEITIGLKENYILITNREGVQNSNGCLL